MLTGHSSIVKRQTAPQLTSRPQSRRAGGAADILVVADVPMAPGELDVREHVRPPHPSSTLAAAGSNGRTPTPVLRPVALAGGSIFMIGSILTMF